MINYDKYDDYYDKYDDQTSCSLSVKNAFLSHHQTAIKVCVCKFPLTEFKKCSK